MCVNVSMHIKFDTAYELTRLMAKPEMEMAESMVFVVLIKFKIASSDHAAVC